MEIQSSGFRVQGSELRVSSFEFGVPSRYRSDPRIKQSRASTPSTPYSELQTPNPELQTRNSELQTPFRSLQRSSQYPALRQCTPSQARTFSLFVSTRATESGPAGCQTRRVDVRAQSHHRSRLCDRDPIQARVPRRGIARRRLR